MLRYWYEARKRIILCLLGYVAAWALGLLSYQFLYGYLHRLYLPIIPTIVISDIRMGVLLPWRMANAFALWVTTPLCVYQFICFISPALYENERLKLHYLSVSATLLFMMGAFLGLHFVMPTLLGMAKEWLPSELLFLPNIDTLISLTQQLMVLSGLVLEIPLLIYQLLVNEWIELARLRSTRGLWVSGIFFLAMVLTPPDVFSQLCLAIPVWLSVEISAICYQIFHRKTKFNIQGEKVC